MRRVLVTLAAMTAVLVASACADSRAEYDAAVDTLSRQQKDSIVSTMPIPGAKGVGRAMDAAEKLRARAEDHDTIR